MTEISSSFKDALMACKSKPIYDRWKQRYEDFKKDNGYEDDGIGTFLEYIRQLSTQVKPSTVWQAASCVNKFLKLSSGSDFIVHPVFKGR